MHNDSLTLAEIVSIWLPMTIVASLLATAAYPVFRRAIRACRPATRAAATLLFGLLPPVIAVVAMILVMHPTLAAVFVPAHCHHGACASHVPVFSVKSLGGISLVVAGSLLLIVTGVALALAIRHGRRRLSVLAAFSGPQPGNAWQQIESDDWLAWCCGLWRPKVLLSRGLVEQLSARELAVVLAHEQAHARRRDNLRALLLNWATLFWLPPGRHAIRRDMADAAEHACDAAAVIVTGDHLEVAATIRSLTARWPGTAITGGAAAFGASDANARIAALDSNRQRHPLCAVAVLGAAWCLMLVVMTPATHGLVEWLGSLGS